MENTLPISNKFRIFLVGLFLLFLFGVVGYLTFRQYSNRAGEFPSLQAQDLSPSTATLLLNGKTNSLDTNGGSYDIVLDTKGEEVSSVNLDFAFPSKDMDVAVGKGEIVAFENGVFTSKVDTDNQTLKLQFGTADGRTFNGNGVLAKLILKRLSNPTSTNADIKLLNSSYIKLAGYGAKAFSINNVNAYSFDLGPLSQATNINNSANSTSTSNSQTMSQASSSTTSSNNAAVVSTSTVVSVQTISSVSSNVTTSQSVTSNNAVTSVASSQVSSTQTQVVTTALSSATSAKVATTSVQSSVVSNSVSNQTSTKSSSNLPSTAVNDSSDSMKYFYLFFVTFGIGMMLFIKSRRKIDFEKFMQK